MQHQHPGRGLFAAYNTNGQAHSSGLPANSMHRPAPTQPRSSRLGWDNGMQPMHVRANGQHVAPELLYTDEDPFIQDLRAQSNRIPNQSTGYRDRALEIDGGRFEPQYDQDQHMQDAGGDYAREEGMSEVEVDRDTHQQASEAGEDTDDDLFNNAFGQMKETPSEENDSDSDIEITAVTPANPNKAKPNGKTTHQIHDLDDPAEHVPNCNPHRRTSTPPATPKKTTTTIPLPTGPKQANLSKDLRSSLSKYKDHHLRTLTLCPSSSRPHPPHRYLIAVLHAHPKHSKPNTEKHFTWMLGNHLTTISTIMQTYIMHTLCAAPIALLHGKERLKETCLVREIDYFNDKFICLRAVYVRDPHTNAWNEEARGKELTEGLIGRPVFTDPEVVVLDDD